MREARLLKMLWSLTEEEAGALAAFTQAINAYLDVEPHDAIKQEERFHLIEDRRNEEADEAMLRIQMEEKRVGGPDELLAQVIADASKTGDRTTANAVSMFQGMRRRLEESGRGTIFLSEGDV